MHTAQATNAELQKTIARMVDGTAQRMLYLIRQGHAYDLGRRMAGGKALFMIEGEALDIESWNAWIEATNNPELQYLKVNEAEVALFDKELTMCDIVNILRKTTYETDGSGLVSIKRAVEIYRNAKDSDGFEGFLDTIKQIGRSHKLIA